MSSCDDCDYNWLLTDDAWKGPVCSAEHDRDINAAQNILYKGVVGRERAEITNACGVPRSTAKQEVCSTIESVFGS